MVETVGIIILTAIEAAGATGAVTAGTFTFASTGISLASVVGSVAVIGASIGLQYALRPGLPKAQDGSQPLRQGIPPRLRGYGRCRIAGYFMLFEENLGNSYDVMAWHSGRACGIVEYFLHDDAVTLVAGEAVSSPYGDGRYSPPHVRIRSSLGEVPPIPTIYFSTPPVAFDGIWNQTDMVGKGIAWASLFCEGVDQDEIAKVYPRGLPTLSVVADLSPCWDPRDPEQDREDESTWTLTYNPVIELIDYLTRADGGLGLDYDIILAPVIDAWIAEINLCDELVDRADGSQEQRYQCHGWFTFDTKPEDVINGILATCDGWLSENGAGTLALKVGVYREPTVTLTARHILDFSLKYGEADEASVNQINISYTEPAQLYAEVQTETLRDEDAISLAGVARAQALDLKWVQSYSQARRLAARAMQRLNPDLSGSFVTPLYGLRALGQRWVRVQYPYVSGLQDCVVEIQGADLDLMAGRIKFDFIRIAPDAIEAYDPATDEGRTPTLPPLAPSLALPVPDHVASSLIGDAGSGYRLLVTFDDPHRSDLGYVIRYRVTDDGTGAFGPWVEQTASRPSTDGTTISITTGLVQAGFGYQAEAATVGPRGTRSEWSITPGLLDFSDRARGGYVPLLEDI